MWTPKRAVLLMSGSGLFLAVYLVYAYFLGGIDGLAPLPEKLVRRPGDAGMVLPPPPLESETDRRLKQAFGLDCPELERTIKLIVSNRGLILASSDAKVLPDGQVRLTKFSIAVFRGEFHETGFPEINTARAEVALLRFDKPITNIMADIGSRRIVGGELKGNIVITNNRRTAQVVDDIEIRVDQQPLYFDDTKSKIWTDGLVTLLDKETRPHPTKIRGEGMDLFLVKDLSPQGADASKAAHPPSNREAVSGVERVVLRANVDMHLYTGFLTHDGQPNAKSAAASQTSKQPEKSQVVIRTQGSFTYDMTKELAWFDCAPAKLLPERIFVIQKRLGADGSDKSDDIDQKWNQLVCDYLELQFQRQKPAAAAAKADNRGDGRAIESARATARQGQDVTLVMDVENLHAQCSELLYFAPTDKRGPQTILKGEGLEVFKDAHRIRARELILVGADKHGQGQQLLAKGPGQVDLYDRNNEARPYPRHAVWKDTLTYARTRDDQRELDLMTLNQDARFIDEEQQQELQAERLLVWLEAEERGDSNHTPRKQSTSAVSQHRPKKVEAFERVKVYSPEFIIRDCRHLLILFEDGRELLPHEVARKAPPQPAPEDPGPEGKKDAPPKNHDPKTTAQAKTRKPIELWSRDVLAKIVRVGPKNDLRELVAEGTVHVHQEPGAPDEKGLNIKGEILTLDHQASGDVLVVKADQRDPARHPAQLQLGELYLFGPKVTINQQKNEAKVEGLGGMQMPSNTTLEGGKPAKPGTRITIHWTKDMFFDGQGADFHGGVVAYQDTSRMTCETLGVTFDKVVSLKEGQKKGDSASVQKLTGYGSVYVDDSILDERGKLVRYQRLTGRQVELDHQAGPGHVTGPGKFYLFQPGTIEPAPKQADPPRVVPPGPKIAKQDKNTETTLTRIDFEDHMYLNNKERRSTFWGPVQVYHLPAKKPDIDVDDLKLPKGGMYLKCDLLNVFSKPLPDGKTSHWMQAEKRVFFRTPEFIGQATVIKYDDATELVIFEGTADNPAQLFQVVQQGGQPKTIRGRVIIYNRKDGTFRLEGGTEIKWSRAEPRMPFELGFSNLFAIARLDANGQDQSLARLATERESGAEDRRGAARGTRAAQRTHDVRGRYVLA